MTVKMRLGLDAQSISAPVLAHEFEEVGIAAVTVNGRTRQQGFHGTVSLDGIRRVVEAVDAIPVVGNGDVRTAQDALRMRQQTGCAAVAIGRGAILDPWIFRKISGLIQGIRQPAEPSCDEQIDFLVRHFTLMTERHGEYSCVLFRKFAAWYGARLGIPEDLEDALRQLGSCTDFARIVAQIRERPGQRRSPQPTAFLKVPNGPIERW